MRYKIRFPSQEALQAALATDAASYETPVINTELALISVEVPALPPGESIEHAFAPILENYDATIEPDFQFDPDSGIFDLAMTGSSADPSLKEVLDLIQAPAAWTETRGSGVTIAIVDTGINGDQPEFPEARRSAYNWAPIGLSAWEDAMGHGTLCACIAAASDDAGGRFVGVAPEATVMSCRTDFYDSELTAIYQLLRDRARAGEIVVASNSFGYRTGTPPKPHGKDFLNAMDEAIEAGVFVVFSAGNNQELVKGKVTECSPTSIWGHKTLTSVITVAGCKLDRTMWEYSSRGAGQFHRRPGNEDKPDVTAPTPKNGRILYGNVIQSFPRGWGTSGSCPQVAGLAALLRSKKPGATRTQLQDAIRNTAASLGVAYTCGGHGLIDCGAAVAAI